MKIVFFGTPEFAVSSLSAIIEHGFQVIAVVTAGDKASGRGLKLSESAVKIFAKSKNIEILQPESLKSTDFIERLKVLNADLFVVVAFRKLPAEVFKMPEYGTINLHASLLPDYRGAAPINWSIINGETETGVTTFFINEKIDCGDILLQKAVKIENTDNAGSLHDKLSQIGSQLLVDTISGIRDGVITTEKQTYSGGYKSAPKIDKEFCRIDWYKSAQEISNFIRGLSPYPGSWTLLQGKLLKVYHAEVVFQEHKMQPGSVFTDDKTYFYVAASQFFISILSIQLEGKKMMQIQDFLKGFRLADNTILGE